MLKEIRAPVQDANGKFKQNWPGPYIIKQIYSEGVVRLMDLDAIPFTKPTNMDQLKKYHVWGGCKLSNFRLKEKSLLGWKPEGAV